METDDCRAGTKAVKRIKDQYVLARIALLPKHMCIRLLAVKKITNQALLARIAMQLPNDDGTMISDIIGRISDQAILADIVNNRESSGTASGVAFERINDRALIEKTAIEGKS